MSKVLYILFLVISIILQLQLFNSLVYAENLPKCPNPNAITDPNPIIGTYRMASLKIQLNPADMQAYRAWKIKVICGVTNPAPIDATIVESNMISATIDKSQDLNPKPCEFAEESNKRVQAIGVNEYGDETPFCQATYNVVSALNYLESQCKLEITPQTNITPNTPLTVKVSGLPRTDPHNTGNELHYKLFVDKNDLTKTPMNSFRESIQMKIPSENMGTNQTHSVYVRKTNYGGSETDGKILPTCQASYTVGSEDDPGKVISSGGSPVGIPQKACTQQDIDAGKCTSGGGDPCTNDTDPRGPGFKTAIGCIRTNPTELAKDLLKFGVGIGGGLAFLMMLLGAFQMLTSAGNPETLNAGRERLTSAVIGLLFIIFSILLLQIIGADILKIPGFDR